MRVFMTGATGFIGSHLVPELIGAGHRVVGLSRSDAGAVALSRAGADVVRGDLADLGSLRAAAGNADAVVHAAFDHDFARLRENSEMDRRAIEALGEALLGSERPLVVASGTGLVDRSRVDGIATEADVPVGSAEFPRGATEEAVDAFVSEGGRAIVMRLAQVHDARHQGRIAQHVRLARETGWVAYVGDGGNRLAAVHVSDAAVLFRLALEKGRAGARYHAVAEEGVPMRDIARVIGARLDLPVRSVTPDEARDYFGPIAGIAALDMAASSARTSRELGWVPSGPDLLSDLRSIERGAA